MNGMLSSLNGLVIYGEPYEEYVTRYLSYYIVLECLHIFHCKFMYKMQNSEEEEPAERQHGYYIGIQSTLRISHRNK